MNDGSPCPKIVGYGQLLFSLILVLYLGPWGFNILPQLHCSSIFFILFFSISQIEESYEKKFCISFVTRATLEVHHGLSEVEV